MTSEPEKAARRSASIPPAKAEPSAEDRDRSAPSKRGGSETDAAPARLASLGARLAWARKRSRLTQKQLSELVGKSRATIVLYELDKVNPPVEQVERIASVLGVGPEYLAFGKHAVSGVSDASGQAAMEIVSLPEISIGKSMETTGVYAVPKTMAEAFGIPVEGGVRVYVLSAPAPEFGFAAGDRVIVNASEGFRFDHALYLLRSPAGAELVRLLPSLSGTSSRVKLNGSHGERYELEPDQVELLGQVVGSILKI